MVYKGRSLDVSNTLYLLFGSNSIVLENLFLHLMNAIDSNQVVYAHISPFRSSKSLCASVTRLSSVGQTLDCPFHACHVDGVKEYHST